MKPVKIHVLLQHYKIIIGTEIFCNSDLMDAMRKEHAVKNRELVRHKWLD